MRAGYNCPAVVTGKPVGYGLGGSLGREPATGRGCMLNMLYALEKLGIASSEATLVVQGIGNVGYWTAKLAEEEGVTTIAASDSSGGLYCPHGFKIDWLKGLKSKHGSIKAAFEAEPEIARNGDFVTNEELLGLPCVVLAPCALENAIRIDNAHNIRARVSVEGANGPTTPEADLILHDKNVLIVPDILANSGGVTVSYFEWLQNMQNEEWDEITVNQKLEKKMRKAFDGFWTKLVEHKVHPRLAAYMLGVGRVAKAAEMRGLWP
jgi:glutamate dehydrogenase (NAD(P)+)